MKVLRKHRVDMGISQAELAALANVSYETIRKYEDPDYSGCGNAEIYLRLSDILVVPIDELLRTDYPETADGLAGHGMRRSSTAVNENPVTVYRNEHKLTFREVASRLGRTSRECGRKACAAKVPLGQHINALAIYEGITPEELLARYSPSDKERR